jgi:putative ABC transport system permease protein
MFLNLIIGYAAFVVISQFIAGQFDYDRNNINYNRICRLQLFMDQPENTIKHTWSVTAALSRKDLRDIPEIEKIVLIHDVGDNNKSGVFLSVDRKNQFLTRYGYYADPSVFDVFTFRFLEGDPTQALSQPYSIVLSEELARRLFPGKSPLGKQVYGENKVVFTVTGVYEDLPVRSTWKPVYLLPMASFSALTGWSTYESDYWSYSFYTYVMLKPNAGIQNVNEKIHYALKDYRKEHHPYLRPLSKLHINPFFEPDWYISITLISFLSILILVLSSVNFINLQTASAGSRLREIGVKKTLGFNRKQLTLQFLLESLSLTIMAALIGVIVAQLSLPSLNNMMGEEMFPNMLSNRNLVLVILFVTLTTGIISAWHPAYVISSYNPVTALKQKFLVEESNGVSLKKVLVTIQFSISIFMLVVAFIVYRQTEFMLTKDLGFNRNTILFSNIITDKKVSIEPLRQKLTEHQEIKNVCVSDYIPFILPGGDDLNWEGALPDEKVFVRFSYISYDFVPAYEMEMVKGRNFSREYPADKDKCLINETAARVFRWQEPLGKQIKVHSRVYEVIGVIKDYTVFSVHNPIEPHLYRLIPDSTISNGVYSVSFVKGNDKKAMEIVKTEFQNFFRDDAFEIKNIQFLIQNENAVKAFSAFRKITGIIAVLTVIISSIGLFGLILFMIQRKMKEIGIRKVLGFSFVSLYYTLSSWFIKLIFISLFISWPAAYYVYKVLPGANKYGIQIWEFLLASSIILSVALATISYQIIKALRVKSVDVLADE